MNQDSKVELGKYRHYKGGEYEVLGVGKNTETLEEFVVYKGLYEGGEIWIRPLSMFLEDVEVGGKKVKRFQKI